MTTPRPTQRRLSVSLACAIIALVVSLAGVVYAAGVSRGDLVNLRENFRAHEDYQQEWQGRMEDKIDRVLELMVEQKE